MEEIELITIDEPKKKIKKKPHTFWLVFWTISNIIAISCLFVAYGPFHQLRDKFITSAMTTFHHRYLARVLYSEETIEKVMSNNYVVEGSEDSNSSLISFKTEDSGVYSSKYEEEILKRDKDAIYKLIPVSGKGYKGTLVAIYDASRVKLGVSKQLGVTGQKISKMAQEQDALVAINASGFDDPNWMGNGGNPSGIVIQNGKIIHRGPATGFGGGIIGFNQDNVLVLTRKSGEEALKMGIRDAIQFGPFLIVNGQPAFMKGNGGWGIAPRSAIAQRKDGIVLFLVVDGRQTNTLGIDMVEMTKILQNYGAYNASNLDGGSSTALVVEGKLYNKPVAQTKTGERNIPNMWMATK